MITYAELVKRAEHLARVLDAMDRHNPDIRYAEEILRPIIRKVLESDPDLPISLPMQSFFYRQENTLPMYVELMNAIARFDVGLVQTATGLTRPHERPLS